MDYPSGPVAEQCPFPTIEVNGKVLSDLADFEDIRDAIRESESDSVEVAFTRWASKFLASNLSLFDRCKLPLSSPMYQAWATGMEFVETGKIGDETE